MEKTTTDRGFMADTAVPHTDTATREMTDKPVATAGPWELSDVRDFGARKVIAWTTNPNGHRWRKTICELREGNLDDAEIEGNRHLIVAAPDLLESCRRLLEYMPTLTALQRRLVREAESAIAKAEGR